VVDARGEWGECGNLRRESFNRPPPPKKKLTMQQAGTNVKWLQVVVFLGWR